MIVTAAYHTIPSYVYTRFCVENTRKKTENTKYKALPHFFLKVGNFDLNDNLFPEKHVKNTFDGVEWKFKRNS